MRKTTSMSCSTNSTVSCCSRAIRLISSTAAFVSLGASPAVAALDEQPRRLAGHVLALEGHPPRVRAHQPRDQVEERRLAGAVRADDGVDRSLADREGDVVDGDEAAERLAYSLDLEYGRA